MRKRRWLWFGAAALAAGALLWWHLRQSQAEGPFIAVFQDDLEKSSDLRLDLKLMWETQPLEALPDPTHGPTPRASTDEAIKAASRVFNTVRLVGKTRQDVVALLGDPRSSSDSAYNFPFWPAPRGALVYRFDCGAYGWQFNVLFDGAGRVKEVLRAWIH